METCSLTVWLVMSFSILKMRTPRPVLPLIKTTCKTVFLRGGIMAPGGILEISSEAKLKDIIFVIEEEEDCVHWRDLGVAYKQG